MASQTGGNQEELERMGLLCSYHREYGHMTERCQAFKKFLEELVDAGHLRQYIERGQEDESRPRRVDMIDQSSEEDELLLLHGVIH